MKIDVSFPDTKISETFLAFAEPLLEAGGMPPTVQYVEKALGIAFVVWNAVVYDTVNGNAHFLTQVRNQLAGHGAGDHFLEQLITRKKTLFGHDLRLVGEYKMVEKDGEWRLRAEARAPSSKPRA